MSDDLRSATTDEGDEIRDYDVGHDDENLSNSAEDTGPSADQQSQPSTSLAQHQTSPTVAARRTSGRQRRGRGRTSGQRQGRGHGPTGSNTYRAFFASEEALRDFRESFQIPTNVELELILINPNNHRAPQPHETVVPIFAVCAAGLRFPIQTFTREFLNALDVTPAQLSLNTFRIVNGIAELKRLHNLEFILDDLFGVYYVGQNPTTGRVFLAPRSTDSVVHMFSTFGLPITSLPDSDKYANDFMFVRGRWDSDRMNPTYKTLASTRQRFANWQRIEAFFRVRDRAAPALLSYVPNYNTTLDQRWRQRRADKLATEEIRSRQVPNSPLAATTSQPQVSAPHPSVLSPLPSHPLRGAERLPVDRDSPDPFQSSDDIMGRSFTPKFLLYTTGVPASSAANAQTQAPTQASTSTDERPTVSKQERRKRRRSVGPDGNRSVASSTTVGDIGQSSLSSGGAESQNRTEEIPTENLNPDDAPWSPRLTYCNRQLELPKDMARVEKDGGDAFVVATQHMFTALQEMASIRDVYNERKKLLLGFEKKVEALNEENTQLKEENAKAKADASSAMKDAADNKKALDELGQKYTEAIQKAASLQVEVDKIPNALKAKEDESWDEAGKTIIKAYED
ncbi:hypothetical protein Vadar_032399 [Vaccinium darrowii]|uniref:Uncharacterized protein n=1 Tax=Vaccinium darrowii TaxID=229202 RepID=A0ACB7Z8H4_9ERIC|nr:hypothetical protein Vadar_032399 [Vaccinium darrowii]